MSDTQIPLDVLRVVPEAAIHQTADISSSREPFNGAGFDVSNTKVHSLADPERPDPNASSRQDARLAGDSEPDQASQQFSLPPVDGGKDAWLFLAACFTLEALVWGFPFAYGVFQEYYSTHEPFAGSSNIAVIGTCAMGIMYLTTPITFGTIQRWPQIQKWSTPGGLFVMCLALSMSSFASNTTQLIATQGVIYALGGGFAYAPCILYIDEWFVRRKGFAYGIMWSGTGLSGVLVPLLLQWLLDSYGYRTALRVWSVVLLLMITPLLYFVKPRVPLAHRHVPRRFDFSWIFTKTFGLLQICNIIEAFGFFLPTIYLPTYARTLGASGFGSALTIILVIVASVFGCIGMGAMIDRLHVTTCILISSVGSTLGVFMIWGFSVTLPPLYCFCIIYGLFAGSFTSTWPGIMRSIVKRTETANSLMVFAALAVGRGIGNVVSGPLSEALIHGMPWKGELGFAYGSGYGNLVLFTGATACLGGASVFGRRLWWV